MLSNKTEQLYGASGPVDALGPVEGAAVILRAQAEAALAVEACSGVIAAASQALSEAIRAGGNLYYIGAGSSGLMAACDAMELGGTFGIAPDRVRVLVAGGVPTTSQMPGDVEDQTETLAADLAQIGGGDCAIVVSASGRTPYAVEGARLARAAGSVVVAIANNSDAELFGYADHTIYLDTPPEILSGSTRMGAGTAQKIALNTLSTLMGVQLGHIYKGRMVSLNADNEKLRGRAAGNVATLTNVSTEAANEALDRAEGNVKFACLLAAGASSIEVAAKALDEADGHIAPAMAALNLKTR